MLAELQFVMMIVYFVFADHAKNNGHGKIGGQSGREQRDFVCTYGCIILSLDLDIYPNHLYLIELIL